MQNNNSTISNQNIIPTNPLGTPNPIDIYVGKRVIEKRSKFPYSRKAFAELLGITENSLEEIECGIIKMPVSLLWYIAALLNEDIEYFFKDIKPAEKNNQLFTNRFDYQLLTDDDCLFDEDDISE